MGHTKMAHNIGEFKELAIDPKIFDDIPRDDFLDKMLLAESERIATKENSELIKGLIKCKLFKKYVQQRYYIVIDGRIKKLVRKKDETVLHTWVDEYAVY